MSQHTRRIVGEDMNSSTNSFNKSIFCSDHSLLIEESKLSDEKQLSSGFELTTQAVAVEDKSCTGRATGSTVIMLSDSEWTIEATIDALLCNLATAVQVVTNKAGQTLTIRKYQSQCRRLARLIPIALPTPEYPIYSSDLKPEVRQNLDTFWKGHLSHTRIREHILHQAVLRLFEALGFDDTHVYISIGRKLKVKFIEN